MNIEDLKNKVLNGAGLTAEEAYWLVEQPDKESLWKAAEEITKHYGTKEFSPCSIINARSGNCTEDCKWCAQSRHFHTGAAVYPIVGKEELMRHARIDESRGVKRFSQVASGRGVHGKDLKAVCDNFRTLQRETSLQLCASLGLLNGDELKDLWDSGVRRYHCNLETAPSYFPKLCSTHTIEDKVKTIKAAKALGFEICSGGIIGMGETEKQRVEFALKLREIQPDSIPINLLNPIPGTPLEGMEPLTDEEILTTVAIFRWIHPRTELRFAGGRSLMSRELQLHAMRIGINGAIIGDLLTTIGSTMADDRKLIREAGYEV